MAEKIKRTSKYVGKTYQNWTVVDIFVRSVQGKKCTRKRVLNENGNLVLAPSKRAGHQTYTYILTRITSDSRCNKRIPLNPTQMRQVAQGLVDIEVLADNYFGKKKTDYRFI